MSLPESGAPRAGETILWADIVHRIVRIGYDERSLVVQQTRTSCQYEIGRIGLLRNKDASLDGVDWVFDIGEPVAE